MDNPWTTDAASLAAEVLRTVADGRPLRVELSKHLAQSVLCSEVVTKANDVLGASPSHLVRRTLELATLILSHAPTTVAVQTEVS